MAATAFEDQAVTDRNGGCFTVDGIGFSHLYPSTGGWAVVFASGARSSRRSPDITSDRISLTAPTRALQETPAGAIVDLRSGANLLVTLMRGQHARRGNGDLWLAFDQACGLRQVTFSQVQGEDARGPANAAYEAAPQAIRSH